MNETKQMTEVIDKIEKYLLINGMTSEDYIENSNILIKKYQELRGCLIDLVII